MRAVRYSLNQKEQLTAFLEAPEVPISNNLAENAIRPFVLGRKNWLFSDSVKGAESSAIVYSLVENGIADEILNHPVVRLAEKLFNKHRLLDYHRILFDIPYREKLISE